MFVQTKDNFFLKFLKLQMFLENTINSKSQTGWIEIICGSMFSGKTEELIRRLRRAQLAKQRIKVFKPTLDIRYQEDQINTHNQWFLEAISVDSPKEIPALVDHCEVVGIDEAQFFDESIVEICNLLANQGKRVIVAGLDMDFKGRPFGSMPNLMAIAEYVTKVHAICVKTGALANYSHRITTDQHLIDLGEKDKYEPLSRSEFWKILDLEKHKK